MKQVLSEGLWRVLACPYCGAPLSRKDGGGQCNGCHEMYRCTDDGQIDLRLRKKKLVRTQFELGTRLLPEGGCNFSILKSNPLPENDFSSLTVPARLTPELLSYFPRAASKNSIMLDLGCGDAIHREVCEYAGFEYTGLDHEGAGATLLADAHALPFKDNSFEFILSIAALEHIRYPFVMVQEVYRVLKPGGRFIGSVTFVYPFHGNSFYHYSHLGTFNTLNFGGFEVEHVSPNSARHTLPALISHGLFPKFPPSLSGVLSLPLYFLHRIWWRFGYSATHLDTASEARRVLSAPNSFFFTSTKPMDARKE